jgi:uncharacterized damage-inducible protein DinB
MSDLAVTYLRAMARNNRWANHRLLTACAGLTQAELDAPRTSFFPSLSATLNHILIIDWFYVDALEGGSLGPAAFADPVPCPTLAKLADEQATVDARLIAFCDKLTPEALGTDSRVSRGEGRWQVERTDRLLLHLFQHDIHHRGQAHAMLSGTSVPPPQLDEFFSVGDAHLRAPDLAALGWTEADVWPQPG